MTMTKGVTLRNLPITMAATVFATLVTAAPPPTTPPGMKVKPDLAIVKVKAERTGLTADGAHQARISATVSCSSQAMTPVSCGPFKIRFEYRSPKSAAWTHLGEAGVASLGSGGASRTVPTATRFFDDTVPVGQSRSYRVTVDSMNQVEESNEGNNSETTSYRAEGCGAADLELTKVWMQRVTAGPDAGTVAVRVYVKNRCTRACVADVEYSVDASETVPGAAIIRETIASRVDGETEIGPLGSLKAPGNPGTFQSYTVRIAALGGSCPDTDTANNVCRVTICPTCGPGIATCFRVP